MNGSDKNNLFRGGTMELKNIEIFAKNSNEKGDLFCRLMGDFFHALGYGQPRYNISKSGREIDIETVHRTETKIAIAECKAHQPKIGGNDINKFVGSLSAETIKKGKDSSFSGHDVVGYFISLSGFTETAIEQELDLEKKRIILIDKEKIIEELIAGNILVPVERALFNVNFNEKQPSLLNKVDLIAHSIGWIWVFYYGENNTPTHFSLVHAEGKPLLESLSKKIINFDIKHKKLFSKLNYLQPVFEIHENSVCIEESRKKYFNYLKNECGNIQFEGLPTDKDAGSAKVELEKIFQPLHLQEIREKEKK